MAAAATALRLLRRRAGPPSSPMLRSLFPGSSYSKAAAAASLPAGRVCHPALAALAPPLLEQDATAIPGMRHVSQPLSPGEQHFDTVRFVEADIMDRLRLKGVMKDLEDKNKKIEQATSICGKATYMLRDMIREENYETDRAFAMLEEGLNDLLQAIAAYKKVLDDLVKASAVIKKRMDDVVQANVSTNEVDFILEQNRIMCNVLEDFNRASRLFCRKMEELQRELRNSMKKTSTSIATIKTKKNCRKGLIVVGVGLGTCLLLSPMIIGTYGA